MKFRFIAVSSCAIAAVFMSACAAGRPQPARSPIALTPAVTVIVVTSTPGSAGNAASVPVSPTLVVAGATPVPATPAPTEAAPPEYPAAAAPSAPVTATPAVEGAQPALDSGEVFSWTVFNGDRSKVATGGGIKLPGRTPKYRVNVQINNMLEDEVRPPLVLIDSVEAAGPNQATYQPMGWSEDGRVFYYARETSPAGCAPFVGNDLLTAVDSVARRSRLAFKGSGISFALSGDSQTLAYITANDGMLVLRNLRTGKERKLNLNSEGVPSEAFAAGGVLWSLDGGTLFLTVAYDACDAARASSAILRIDAATLNAEVIIPKDNRLLLTRSVSRSGWIQLIDHTQTRYLMDPHTLELVEAGK